MKELKVTISKEVEKVLNGLESKKPRDMSIACPKGLKVNLQANKDLNILINSYYLSTYELAEHRIALQKDNKVLVNSIDKLAQKAVDGEISDRERAQLDKDSQQLAINQGLYSCYNSTYKKFMGSITKETHQLYAYYWADIQVGDYGFTCLNRALEQWFLQFDIQYNKGLKQYFMSAIGSTVKGTVKTMVNNTYMLKLKESAFNETFLNTLVQLAIFKNAISLRTIRRLTEKSFSEYQDMPYEVVDQEPATIKAYKELFDKVGLSCTNCATKEQYQKLFAKSANRLFVYVG